MMSKNVVQDFAKAQGLARVNLNITRLTLEAARYLVNQYARMR